METAHNMKTRIWRMKLMEYWKKTRFEFSFSLTQSRKLETVFKIPALITDGFSGGWLAIYNLKKKNNLSNKTKFCLSRFSY